LFVRKAGPPTNHKEIILAKLTAKVIKNFPIPGDPDNAELRIQHLKPGEVAAIEAETSKWVGKSQGDDFASELQYDPTTQMRKLRTAAVVGWKGFYGLSGEELDCNNGNKMEFLKEDPMLGEGEDAKKLSDWIDQFRKELADSLKPQEAQAEGN